MNILVAFIGILLTIFFVVGVHELGHFIAARCVGVKVLRFSIGFGKSLFRWHDKKGTEYVLAAIPLGGYIKMLDEEEGVVAYNRQPFYKKFIVIAAGPFSNLLFAFLLYWSLFMIGFVTISPVIGNVLPNSIAANAGLKSQQEILSIDNIPTSGWMSVVIRVLFHAGNADSMALEAKNVGSTAPSQSYLLNLKSWHLDNLKPDALGSLGLVPFDLIIPPVINKILPDTPAAKSHLKTGDTITAINNKPIAEWDDLLEVIDNHPGETLNFTVKRGNLTQTLQVLIGTKPGLFFKKYGFLGIASDFQIPPNLLRTNKYGPIAAMSHAWRNTYDFIYLNFLTFGKLLTGKMSVQSLGGPIAIFSSAGSALNAGFIPFISFLAFLSIAIGVVNILPIPGLDGGHILFLFIEGITRKPLAPRTQTLCYRIGMAILLVLVFQAVINDLLRL